MKHALLVRTLAVTLLTTAAFAAAAQTKATTGSVDAHALEQPVTDGDARRAVETDTEINRSCLRSTGSRIAMRHNTGKRCTAYGRVYTQQDILSTGAVDLTDALRMLDPAFR